MTQVSGSEPQLTKMRLAALTGFEPALGGRHRIKIDRALFWSLLDLVNEDRRSQAINKVLDMGYGRFYGAAMRAVLSPNARYWQVGHLFK
ncbi:MAG: hypothetical protein GYB68_16540, partial [Chloroflexi bacterium]|nr:hypothetical protein [Chloroflexota bacterium]